MSQDRGVLLAYSMMRYPLFSAPPPRCVQGMSSSSTGDDAPGKRPLQSPEEGAGPASWVVKRQRSGALVPGSNELQRPDRHTGAVSPAPSAGEGDLLLKFLCSPRCVHRVAVTALKMPPPSDDPWHVCRWFCRHRSLAQTQEVPDLCKALHLSGQSSTHAGTERLCCVVMSRFLNAAADLGCTGVHMPICIARAAVHAVQVEDCTRDVCELSTYHFRYRICNVHIRLPAFMRQGKLQRFCQQCGRCHELSEFEGNQRSCRAQLDRHNARYRPDVLGMWPAHVACLPLPCVDRHAALMMLSQCEQFRSHLVA